MPSPAFFSAWTVTRIGVLRWRSAIRRTVAEIVAEKRAVWRSAGMAPRIA
jgi:hypothetical protein